MTDRDRLIELLKKPNKTAILRKINPQFVTDETDEESIVADYLLANGVIVPPIEVGQTVWYVDDFTEEIEECKVYGFAVVNGKLSLLVDNGECKFVTRKWCNTKEEAEAELRKRGVSNV